MKPRAEAAALINMMMTNTDVSLELPMSAWHYGKQELKELLDFIYEGTPNSTEGELTFKGNK